MHEQNTIPFGSTLSGRVITSYGEPIDAKGPLTGTQPVSLTSTERKGAQEPVLQLFETGIKVIDLLAPIPRGGLVSLVGGNGIGKMVAAEEIMHNIVVRQHGTIVCVEMEENGYAFSSLTETVKEANLQDRTIHLFEPQTAGRDIAQRIVQAGVTIASHLRSQGSEVLLVINLQQPLPAILDNIAELKRVIQQQAITTIFFHHEDEPQQNVTHTSLANLDARIIMSRDLARKGLWPAINPLASTSRLFETDALSQRHIQVAQQVRQLLQQAQALHGKPQLSAEQQQLVQRAEHIQLFCTQPFTVAEAFSEIPGEYLTIAETVSNFAALLSGSHDTLPDYTFKFIGTLDQAVAKSNSLKKKES